MNKANDLKNTLLALFRSGADAEHSESEMMELLDGIDFTLLLQALRSEAETVYEYHAYGKTNQDFHYHGAELLPEKAVFLCDDARECTTETALCLRTLELWLMPDMTLMVTSCFTVDIGLGDYMTEYRTVKTADWIEAGMEIDFVQLALDLVNLCIKACENELPMYEL